MLMFYLISFYLIYNFWIEISFERIGEVILVV